MQTQNPYAAPGETPTWETPTTGGATAVFIGASIGAGMIYITGILLNWVVTWIMTLDGVPVEKLYVAMGHSVPYLTSTHIAAIVCMFVGGFWSARLSNEKHLTHAFLAGLISTTLALIQFTYPYDLPMPDWSKVISLIVPIPSYVFGAWWERRVNGK